MYGFNVVRRFERRSFFVSRQTPVFTNRSAADLLVLGNVETRAVHPFRIIELVLNQKAPK